VYLSTLGLRAIKKEKRLNARPHTGEARVTGLHDSSFAPKTFGANDES